MKHSHLLGLLLSGLLISNNSQAQNQINKEQITSSYGEVGYIPLTVRFANGTYIEPELVNLKFGMTLNKNLSIEGMAATTVEKYHNAGIDLIGFYIKPKVALSENIEIFALTGLTHIRAEGAVFGASNRVSLGAGIQKAIGEQQYLQLNYMRYATGKDREVVQGFNLTLGTSF
mgnify:CR=1 FL=1